MKGGEGPAFALELLAAEHVVCRLAPDECDPAWARPTAGAVLAVTRTGEELSIVCEATQPPPGTECSAGWRALRVAGSLEHSMTGVLLSIAAPLAAAGIPIFAVSTFDTDYVLVPGPELDRAISALADAGHPLS